MKEFSKEWFDESSNEWMKNKIKVKSGYFKYICEHIKKNNKQCKNYAQKTRYCKFHEVLY